MGKLAREQLRRVGLGEDARFEIGAGRKTEIGVRRPREAIDAAMLATLVRIDRAVEGYIGRGVARDDGARGIAQHLGLQRRRLLVRGRPAVVDQHPGLALVAAGCVRPRAATAQGPGVGGYVVNRFH